ncbi:MAG: OmpA family protein [Bacteroidetes bacterium]|nr:OmpA family protein [Bacteroidota bacterium]
MQALWAQKQNKLPVEYKLTQLKKINHQHSAFCPAMYENKLYYTSWKKPDLVNYENLDLNQTPYLAVYYTEIKNDTLTEKTKPFKKTNKEYHNGPLSFSPKGDICLTRVTLAKKKGGKGFVNRPQLYFLQKTEKGWSKPQAFAYNDLNYSFAHGCFSADGNYLYFTSDRPGGYGSSDIWVCKKNTNGWDAPVNLGALVNTSSKEDFPYASKEGVLFFSSDRAGGQGGLDLYSAKQEKNIWKLNRNEGAGINSAGDDFGVFFISSTKGYVSSNRDNKKNNDNLYFFTFTKAAHDLKGVILTGQDTSLKAANLKLILEDSTMNHLAETRTDKNGRFVFKEVAANKKYMIKVDEADPAFSHYVRYYYMDENHQVSRVTMVNEKGEKFVFRNLPSDTVSLAQLDVEDDVNFAGNLLFGENPSKPIANKKIVLKDGNGNIIDETTTNSFGAFVFNKIPSTQTYLVEIIAEDGDPFVGSKIILTNKSGKEVQTLVSAPKTPFTFRILASDKATMQLLQASDSDLLIDIEGSVLNENKTPIQKASVFLKNTRGEAKGSTVTDEKGSFAFKKIYGGENYQLNLDENDPQLQNINKIYLVDKTGKIVQELIRNRLKGFAYAILKSDNSKLKAVYVDDPWLDVLSMNTSKDKSEKKEEITIIENIYYALNEYKFDEAGRRVMDKVVQIMNTNPKITMELSSHTDSQGDDKNNLILSQKRAKYAVDYIVSKGIAAKRLKAIGYGETHLINKCANNVPCTEAEHAQNRRTEFKVEQGQ